MGSDLKGRREMTRAMWLGKWWVIGILSLLCAAFVSARASAAGLEYQFDAQRSLTGDCSAIAPDTVQDPGCPYSPPPGGPSGRFEWPRSIAIDSYGNVYVASYGDEGTDGRIDIFDDEGNFITELMDPFGPKSMAVDSKGNLYVFEHVLGGEKEIARYAPSVYEPKVGKIEYDIPRVVVDADEAFSNNSGLAVDSATDHVFAALGFFINEYGSAAEGNKPLNTLEDPKIKSSNWVAVDGERRRLYASYCQTKVIEDCGVLVFSADAPYGLLKEIDGSGLPLKEFRSQKGWTSIAIDEETGHFFVEDLEQTKNVYEFDEKYEYVSTIVSSHFQGGSALQMALSNSPLKKTASNRRHLFVPVVLGSGRAFAFKPAGVMQPRVEMIRATNIGESEAELRAMIDPRGGDTSYVFEYVAQDEFQESKFDNALLAGEGVIPGESQAQEVSAIIGGLTPGTAYRFRVRVENKAGSAEPAAEATFTTYSDASISTSCANHDRRLGASSVLPDCRAYELVSPRSTNGRPPRGVGYVGDRFGTVHSSPTGDSVSFILEGGTLPGSDGTGGFYGDPYRSNRDTTGWGTTLVGPPGAATTHLHPGGFSSDQGFFFWAATREGSAVVAGDDTRYVRYPDGHSELIGRGSLGSDPRAIGVQITEGGSHIIFRTHNFEGGVPQQLEPNAPPAGTIALYDRTADEVTHVVSLLPGDVTPAAGEHATYLGTSPDASGIAFEIGNTLFLRKDNAATYEIGENVEFAGVSGNGERIFYVEGGDLYAFDTATEEAIAFTSIGNATPVNVASGGTRAYFVTTSVIPGGGQNPNGAFAKAGQQNLYLSEEGDITFVATVTNRDVDGEIAPTGVLIDGLGLWVKAVQRSQPGVTPSRANSTGDTLLFQSRANLDDYESEGSPQIYRYDLLADRLHCISCPPTKAKAAGGGGLQTFSFVNREAPFSPYGFVPNLGLAGKRVLFESKDALVSRDTNGVQDVYEWEEEGIGSCERAGGCVYLISTGRSPRDNFLFGHSEGGDSVFFTTADVLVTGDEDTRSIYGARVEGGFLEVPNDPCSGEACPVPLGIAPPVPTPVTTSIGPSGNFLTKKKCPKGKRKIKRRGKARCVKKRQGRQQRGSARRGAAK